MLPPIYSSPDRHRHVYDVPFSDGQGVQSDPSDFTLTRVAEGISIKGIRTLVSKGREFKTILKLHKCLGPSRLFRLVKARYSFNTPQTKRDFRYTKKIYDIYEWHVQIIRSNYSYSPRLCTISRSRSGERIIPRTLEKQKQQENEETDILIGSDNEDDEETEYQEQEMEQEQYFEAENRKLQKRKIKNVGGKKITKAKKKLKMNEDGVEGVNEDVVRRIEDRYSRGDMVSVEEVNKDVVRRIKARSSPGDMLSVIKKLLLESMDLFKKRKC